MYHSAHFKETDADAIWQFLQEHSFIFLCGVNSRQEPVATQVPVFIDKTETGLILTGHIMKSTDHHKAFMENPNVLAVFTGSHSYVSASWYKNKQQASTWNYMSVHAKGRLHFLGEEELRSILQRTTDHFENNPHSGANYKDLPAAYITKHLEAIIAFEIAIQQVDPIFKLSQNRDEKSYDNIMQQLSQKDNNAQAIAKQMEARKENLFPKNKTTLNE